METRIVERLGDITAEDWNRLNPENNPFLRHEFLAGMESTGCVGRQSGWLPKHIAIYEGEQLVAAAPMYEKHHSFGEFIFDWAWANAYQRAGLAYYPKLVIAIPFTPVAGPRLLTAPGQDSPRLKRMLVERAMAYAQERNASTIHWLFTNEDDTTLLQDQDLAMRSGFQFHWHNHDYADFDAFLETLSAKKRKNIKRERRRVREMGVTLQIRHGDEIPAQDWSQFYQYYAMTSWRKGGEAYLKEAFLHHIARTIPKQVLLVSAHHDEQMVAGALCLRNETTLFGRNWGSLDTYHSLHFETCYYAPLDYCIRHGLRHFEAGAQGEHKLSRGFLPSEIRSAHWVADAQFRTAISRYVREEQRHIHESIEELESHSPFRAENGHVVDAKPQSPTDDTCQTGIRQTS